MSLDFSANAPSEKAPPVPRRMMAARVITYVSLAQIFAFQLVAILVDIRLFPYIQYTSVALLYLALGALLLLEMSRLAELRVDGATLGLFIVSAFLRRRLGIGGELYFLLVIAGVGAVVVVAVWMQRPVLRRTGLWWIVLGILAGGLLVLPTWFGQGFAPALGKHAAMTVLRFPAGGGSEMFVSIVRALLYHLSFGVPVEELLFRGFLWGELQRRLGSANRACLVQGALFWLMHWPKIIVPWDFFVVIGVLTAGLSLLTLRSRHLLPAMTTHLTFNALLEILWA